MSILDMNRLLYIFLILFPIIIYQKQVSGNSTIIQLDFNYHNHKSMTKYLRNFAKTYPDLATLDTIGKSIEKRDLWVMKIAKKSNRTNIANIKLLANIHGNEAVGREVLLHFLQFLGENYKKDERIKHLLEHNAIHVLPSMNPDGFEISRMECETNNGRENKRTVDLNRNFPDPFVQNDIPRRQPETLAVIKWMNNINFILSACLHGGAMVANYPFDSVKVESAENKGEESKTPDNEVFRHLATVYSSAHPVMHLGQPCEENKSKEKFKNGITNGAAWYTFVGGMQDYNYAFKGCMEITLEISCCKYPTPSKLEGLWEENKNALLEYCLQANLGVKGIILDKTTNQPIANARIVVDKIDKTFYSDKYGEFYRILLPKNYTLKVSADSYRNTTKQFVVKTPEKYPVMTVLKIYLTSSSEVDDEENSETEKAFVLESTTMADFTDYNTPSNFQSNEVVPELKSQKRSFFLNQTTKHSVNQLLIIHIVLKCFIISLFDN